jgi:hypothetical protein
VPTPFYHLHVAEALLENPGLKPSVRDIVIEHFPAFLLGNVAPDVQVISGQTRESTHFYSLPVQVNTETPWQKIQQDHPSLNPGLISNLERRIFILGYECHLQADWFWAEQIFEPFFGPTAQWKDFRQRLYLHNVLRAYLDFRVLDEINGEVCLGLGQGLPPAWLPFVEAAHLQEWRNFIADQLKPGASIRTVDVFAKRQGISAKAYYQLISTKTEMQRQIFDFLPKQRLVEFRETVIDANLELLNKYLI